MRVILVVLVLVFMGLLSACERKDQMPKPTVTTVDSPVTAAPGVAGQK